MKKIVITGGAGYLGSVLVEEAIFAGYEVHVVDRFFFGTQSLDRKGAILHHSDVRNLNPSILENAFAVIDLAAISNDPAGELNQTLTLDINYRARRRLQELCLEAGIDRYLLASSCSVYGFQEGTVSETSQVNPLTTYAEANVLAENSAFSLESRETSFTSLRLSTIFGLSPRMRFDLVVNAMALNAYKTGVLRILRDGSQWRPMIHVRDASRAFIQMLREPKEKIADNIFNIGGNGHNFQVAKIAQSVGEALEKELILDWYGDLDNRSYKVSFDKVMNQTDFVPEWTVEMATLEITKALELGQTKDELITRTLEWYQHLASSKGSGATDWDWSLV